VICCRSISSEMQKHGIGVHLKFLYRLDLCITYVREHFVLHYIDYRLTLLAGVYTVHSVSSNVGILLFSHIAHIFRTRIVRSITLSPYAFFSYSFCHYVASQCPLFRMKFRHIVFYCCGFTKCVCS
jgi:hypothetical protein